LIPAEELSRAPSAAVALDAVNLLGTLPVSQISGAFPASRLGGTILASQLPPPCLWHTELLRGRRGGQLDHDRPTWNYRSQDTAVRHLGPTAQDFHAAFALGENETSISTVDEGGVALAAIQGLNLKLEATRAENAQLRAQIDELKNLVEQLAKKTSPAAARPED
jgi:hypothetical protein